MAGALGPAGSNQQIPLATTFKPGEQRVQDDAQRAPAPAREQNTQETKATARTSEPEGARQALTNTSSPTARSAGSAKAQSTPARGSLVNVVV